MEEEEKEKKEVGGRKKKKEKPSGSQMFSAKFRPCSERRDSSVTPRLTLRSPADWVTDQTPSCFTDRGAVPAASAAICTPNQWVTEPAEVSGVATGNEREFVTSQWPRFSLVKVIQECVVWHLDISNLDGEHIIFFINYEIFALVLEVKGSF